MLSGTKGHDKEHPCGETNTLNRMTCSLTETLRRSRREVFKNSSGMNEIWCGEARDGEHLVTVRACFFYFITS